MCDYVVCIVGYEGIDHLFGPMNKEIAFEIAVKFKKLCEANDKDQFTKGGTPIRLEYDFDELYGFNPTDYKPKQICIMKRGRPMECACKEFPDLPQRPDAIWLY